MGQRGGYSNQMLEELKHPKGLAQKHPVAKPTTPNGLNPKGIPNKTLKPEKEGPNPKMTH